MFPFFCNKAVSQLSDTALHYNFQANCALIATVFLSVFELHPTNIIETSEIINKTHTILFFISTSPFFLFIT